MSYHALAGICPGHSTQPPASSGPLHASDSSLVAQVSQGFYSFMTLLSRNNANIDMLGTVMVLKSRKQETKHLLDYQMFRISNPQSSNPFLFYFLTYPGPLG